MSDRRAPASTRKAVILLSRRALIAVTVSAVALVVLVGLVASGALARVGAPITVAGPADVALMQSAAERDVERAYESAIEQLRKVRALRLAISAAQADAIATKAVIDLRTLRHSAFLSLGNLAGKAPSDAERYASGLDERFDAQPTGTDVANPAVLLAPKVYAIAARMSALATQIADQAASQLTGPAATASPTTRPSPTSTPTPTPTPTR